jgi:hypothetical protein
MTSRDASQLRDREDGPSKKILRKAAEKVGSNRRFTFDPGQRRLVIAERLCLS